MTRAQQKFIKWLKVNDPMVFRLAVKRHKLKTEGPSALGFLPEGFFQTIADTVQTALPAAISYKQQSQILKAQVERAKQGLPPLQTSEYAPVIKVAPAFDQESEAALTRMAMQTTQSGIQKLMPVALAGIGAVVLVMILRKPQRGRR